MQRLTTSLTVVLGMALLMPVSQGQVRGGLSSDNQQDLGRPATTAVSPRGHQGVMPTPIGVSPAPAPAFPRPTPIGVPPMLPAPGNTNTFDTSGGLHHRHHHDAFWGGAFPVYIPVPVAVDPYSMYQDEADQQGADEQTVIPGPTVFERRTPDEMATESSAPEASAAQPAPSLPDTSAARTDAASSAQPAQPQEPSVLVFLDGHQLEVQNYAIVGDVLYDFTPGHMRKVPLSQLNVPATIKANDDRGVDFTLPALAKGGR